MERLKILIEQHGRWRQLEIFIERIEASRETDFSLAVENAKALLESIAKEICVQNSIEIGAAESFNAVLKKAFVSLGYRSDDLVLQVSRSLSNIAQQMGNLRNEIGTTSHGRPLEEIEARNSRVNDLTKSFLIDSTVLIASFLILNFEKDFTISGGGNEKTLSYDDCADFNQEWDDIYGEISMGSYTFFASEILFTLDYNDYIKEYNAFKLEPPEL